MRQCQRDKQCATLKCILWRWRGLQHLARDHRAFQRDQARHAFAAQDADDGVERHLADAARIAIERGAEITSCAHQAARFRLSIHADNEE
jgi:hypothetical protein